MVPTDVEPPELPADVDPPDVPSESGQPAALSTAPEAVVGTAPEAVVGTAPEAVVGTAPEAVVGTAPEAVVGTAPEAVVGTAPEAVVGTAPEAVVVEPEPPPAPWWFFVGLGFAAGVSLVIQLSFIHRVAKTAKLGGDAYYYANQAKLLIEGHWFVDPYKWAFSGHVLVASAAHPPLTTLSLVIADIAGATSYGSHMVWMGLLFTAAVVICGLVGRLVAGPRAGILAALLVATYPDLWVNPSVVMSETLVILAVALLLWAVLRFWRRPTLRVAVEIGVYLALAALARSELVLLVLLVGIPVILLCRKTGWRKRLMLVVAMGLTFGLVCGPWVGRNLATFHHAEFLSDQGGATLAVSNCNPTYYGPTVAWWNIGCIQKVPLPAHNDESDNDVLYRKIADHYIATHRSRFVQVVLLRAARLWGIYRPYQQTTFDVLDGRPQWVSLLGLWFFYPCAALSVAALVILRRRRVLILPFVALMATSTIAVMATFADTRYRVEADTALAILSAVTLDALLGGSARVWRHLWRRPRHAAHAHLVTTGGAPSLGADELTPGLPLPTAPGPASPEHPAHRAPEVFARKESNGHDLGPGLLEPDAASDARPLRPPRFPAFDGLRAIAAIGVLLVHTTFVTGITSRSSFGNYTARLEIGVSVFFLISGFLLYRPFAVAHLSGDASPGAGAFWVRRLLRIVPAYWLVLTLSTFVLHADTIGPEHGGLSSYVVHYLFGQIYVPDQIFHGVTQAWTLCVEMSFYLFLPLYAALIGWGRARRSLRARLGSEFLGVLGLLVINVCWRVWVLSNQHGHSQLFRVMTVWLPAELDLFSLGLILAVTSAWFHHTDSEPRLLGQWWFPWASWICAGGVYWALSHLGMPIVPVFTQSYKYMALQTLYGLFAFFLLLPAVFGPQDKGVIRRFLRSWPMASLGVVSYGIYLWHETWIDKLLDQGHLPLFRIEFWGFFVLIFGMSVLSAALSYFVFEKPALRLKNAIGWRPSRFHRQRSGPLSTSPTAGGLEPTPPTAAAMAGAGAAGAGEEDGPL